MGRRREYQAEVRAIIAEKDGETMVTLRGEGLSGSLSLAQAKATLQPGTVVRITVDGGD